MENSRSLILITVDCLRADHVGFMGYGRPTTPFLDSLADESFIFPTAIVGGAPTYYSFPAMLAARHPLALGRDLIGLAPAEPNLANVLQQSGYATAAFGAANPYISETFGYDQGFDTFRDFLDAEVTTAPDLAASGNGSRALRGRANRSLELFFHRLGPVSAVYDELYFQYCQRLATPREGSLDTLRRFPAADAIVNQACTWLASVGQRPFFLWLHLMDPHAPYYPTEESLSLMGHEEVTPFRAQYLNSYWNRSDLSPGRLCRHRDHIIALYDAGIRWVDAQLAKLVDTLRRFQLWQNCLLAFTADHGEEFLDHEGRFHPPSRATEEIIHVPLLVRIPGLRKVQLPSNPFSHLHLAPTLLDAMNVESPAEFRGHSHRAHLQHGSAWHEPAIVESIASCTNPMRAEARLGARMLIIREVRYKLVLCFDPPHEQLFDLEADPVEQKPLPQDAEKAVRGRLLEYARLHLQSSWQQRNPRQQVSSRLRDLRLQWANQHINSSL